jgi:hypothetical protein
MKYYFYNVCLLELFELIVQTSIARRTRFHLSKKSVINSDSGISYVKCTTLLLFKNSYAVIYPLRSSHSVLIPLAYSAGVMIVAETIASYH